MAVRRPMAQELIDLLGLSCAQRVFKTLGGQKQYVPSGTRNCKSLRRWEAVLGGKLRLFLWHYRNCTLYVPLCLALRRAACQEYLQRLLAAGRKKKEACVEAAKRFGYAVKSVVNRAAQKSTKNPLAPLLLWGFKPGLAP